MRKSVTNFLGNFCFEIDKHFKYYSCKWFPVEFNKIAFLLLDNALTTVLKGILYENSRLDPV